MNDGHSILCHWRDPRGTVLHVPNSFHFIKYFKLFSKTLGSSPTRIPQTDNIAAAPSTPVIDVPKCSRSSSSVVIVLSPPENESDVIDGYYVYYCSNEQRQAGDQVSILPFVGYFRKRKKKREQKSWRRSLNKYIYFILEMQGN